MRDAAVGAHAAGRDPVSDDPRRTANLLGALALAITERTLAALHDEAPAAGTDAMALVALRNYADGAPLDTLRSGLGLSQPGTVRLVDRLEARGLVERRRSATDGRARAVHLTATGGRAVDAALAARERVAGQALDALPDDDRERLSGLLETLLAAQTTDRTSARRICRLCDGAACGHPGRCPVTRAVRA